MSFTRGARSGGFQKDLTDVPSRHSRDGWTHVKDHSSVYIDGKQYRDMREWTRPCVICGGGIDAYERTNMVDANSRFSNRTCKDHRGLMPAFEKGYLAWDATKHALVAGPRCSATRLDATPVDLNLGVTKEELDELYANNESIAANARRLTAENETLKAQLANGAPSGDAFAMLQAARKEITDLRTRLAKYELAPALQASGWFPPA